MSINIKELQILRAIKPAKFFLILLVGFSILVTSCNKSSVVGLDVQPSSDILGIIYTDTTTLETKTVREDSLRTDELQILTGDALLGKYIDPVFDTTSSSIYTQVRLPSSISATSFGTNPICDSIVLSLIYNPAYYGKKERKAQTVNVYQVLDDIPVGAKYSNASFNHFPTDLTMGGYSFIPRPMDSVSVMGVKVKPQLRIKLDNDLGNTLLENQTTGNLISNASFQAFLKGLYITTENTDFANSGDGNILHFMMGDSKMTVYYHSQENDSLNYDFSLGSVARFMHFSHDYTSANPELSAQLSANPPAQDTVVFIQSLAGVKTKVEMPTLMDLVKTSPVAINKAELVIKVGSSSAYQLDTFAAPPTLIVFGINDDGSSYVLPDYTEIPYFYNGNYNTSTHEYHLIITRYLQQVLDGKRKNNGLYLLVPHLSAVTGANRVTIGGGGSSSAYRMKFNITYTKLH